jgi:hypothetical protein
LELIAHFFDLCNPTLRLSTTLFVQIKSQRR